MAESSDQINSGNIFKESMEESLKHLDEMKDALSAEQVKVIDLQIAAKEELKRIEDEAQKISEASIEQKRIEYLEQIRNEVLSDVVKKLILSGVPSDNLRDWLKLKPRLLADVWFELGFETIDDAYIGHVAYDGSGKSGSIILYRNDCYLKLPFEHGHKNVLAVIDIPTEDEWEKVTGMMRSDRQRMLEFIARRVVRDQAPNGHYVIHPNRIEIQS